LVGQRGTRISAVINELGGEKIDAIQYSEDPEEYVANSLSPSNVIEVKIMEKNKALAIVPNDQISLAIGKDGQNVRLAAKLTGWKIDVRGPGEESTEDTEDKEKEEDTENTEKEDKKDKKEKEDKKDKTEKKAKKEKKEKKVKKEKKPKKEKKELKKKVNNK
jgi:N utilization substance protein A